MTCANEPPVDPVTGPGTAFVGATLIDGTGAAPVAGSAVVCAGGRVTWVGTAADLGRPPGLRLVDVSGKYLIPGLLDANVHLVLHCDPEILLRYRPGDYDDLVLEAAQVALHAGITTVFDTWGPFAALRRVRDRIHAGAVQGCRIFLAGNIIGNDGPWSADFFPYGEGLNPAVTETVNRCWEQGVGAELTWMPAAGVRTAVREYVAGGIDFVKYAASAHAHSRFLALSPASQRAIIEEAHSAGLTAQACALTPEAMEITLDAGVDLLQHANSTGRYPLPDETVEVIATRRVPCVLMLYSERFLARAGADPRIPEHARTAFAIKDGNARNLIKAGAMVVHATDGGIFGPTARTSPWVGGLLDGADVPIRLGTSHIHWHRAAIERGMTPAAALQAATRNVARAYRKDADLGTIELGKRADLLILDADPFEDPENYGRIAHVVKDGAIVNRERLPERPVLTRGA